MKMLVMLTIMLLGWVAGERTAQAAEVFVEAGVGTTVFQLTTPDGIWWQSPFPNEFDLTSLSWKAGLGLQLDEHWSVTGSYVSLGTTKAVAEYVSDHDFDAKPRRLDGTHYHLTAYDSLAGPQLVASYRWTDWAIQPKLSGGVAYLAHHLKVNQTVEFNGEVPMVVTGGGLCWQWVCGDVTYYRGVQAPQYPISTQAIVPMFTVKYPF